MKAGIFLFLGAPVDLYLLTCLAPLLPSEGTKTYTELQ